MHQWTHAEGVRCMTLKLGKGTAEQMKCKEVTLKFAFGYAAVICADVVILVVSGRKLVRAARHFKRLLKHEMMLC